MQRALSVYANRHARAIAGIRSAETLIAEEICYVSEPEFIDPDGAIWGAMVTCVLYIGDDDYDPFGYHSRTGTVVGDGGGVPPLPCTISENFTVNALISGSPSLQSVLAADATKYGAPVTFNVIQGASSQNINAEAHYATHSIDFYTHHSGDGAQVLEHEGLHLFDEKPDLATGIRPNPFPGESNFQSQRIVTLTDGTQLTFNIAAIGDTMNTAYAGYEHFMIHDQIVAWTVMTALPLLGLLSCKRIRSNSPVELIIR